MKPAAVAETESAAQLEGDRTMTNKMKMISGVLAFVDETIE